ncbi:MAG: major capsid protein [Spirochaetaceae bacterium]|jgi:hypothetical protein|nr:major capsid protein [Spirochaetaceae bacterium]
MANNLTTQLKIFHEERPARLADFVELMFPQKRVFDSEKIPVDQLLPTGALAGYRNKGAPSNILKYNAGTGFVGVPPIIAVKTSVNEELAGAVTVGMEANAPANQQLLQKYVYIQQQHEDAVYTTIAKQAADILLTGKFTPVDDKNNPVDTGPIDFGRDSSLTVSGAYGADPVKQIADTYKPLKKFGVPTAGLFAIVGSDVMGLLQKNEDFMNLLKLQGLNAGKNWVSPDNRVVGTIIKNTMVPGAAVPMTIISFDEGYSDSAGAWTPFIPPKAVVISSFSSPRFACYGGVFIVENKDGRIYAGDIVTDKYMQKDPDQLVLRTQSRPLLLPANINHTACSTSTN